MTSSAIRRLPMRSSIASSTMPTGSNLPARACASGACSNRPLDTGPATGRAAAVNGGPPRPGPLPPSTSATHEYRLDRATNKDDHSHDPQRRRAVADIRSETPAGFGSEQVAGFILECMAGFVGIRSQPPDYPYFVLYPPLI